MKVTILVPTLNEITGIKQIMPQIKKEWSDQILILDGGSTDGTIEYAREQGYDLVIQKEPGLKMGYSECYAQIKGEVVITFSPDGNSLPGAIPRLISKIKDGYDLVIASRYLKGAKSYDDTFLTGLGNYLFTKIIGLFGYPYTDAMVMYRAYRRAVPEKLNLLKRRSAFYEKYIGHYLSWEPLMSVRAAKARIKIAEIPADEPKRIEDETKHKIILPTSKINHFKAGLACLFLFLEEMFRQ